MTLLPHPHLTLLTLSFLDIKNVTNVQGVCKHLRDLVAHDVGLWRGLLVRDFASVDIGSVNTSASGENAFRIQYKKEFTVPHCNGLGVKFSVTRVVDKDVHQVNEEAKKDGKKGWDRIFSDVKVEEVVCKLVFTTTLINQTDKDMSVHSGYSFSNPSLEEGSCFRVRLEDSGEEVKPDFIGGFRCGTGARETFYDLEANQSARYETSAYLARVQNEQNEDSTRARRLFGKAPKGEKLSTQLVLFFVPTHRYCEFCIRLETNDEADMKNMRVFVQFENNNTGFARWHQEKVDDWKGLLRSKAVPLA